jgi:hypothetical protein
VQRAAKQHHSEVREIVPTHHCLVRFRQRRPFRELGTDAVMDALIAVLEDADVSRWPPAWAAGERDPGHWAASGELAFPLERTPQPGRYVATTCLSKPRR